MINLFGPVKITVSDFAIWPDHMQVEYALLLSEVVRDRTIGRRVRLRRAGRNPVPVTTLLKVLDQGCRPFARVFSEARELDGEVSHAPR